ncbi:hypothetical protein LLEC1_04349 [Akanthomyces lecanii]|uniref:Enoyl reductase (ER) domain-containing protein n=1 Tax=Cordyceps confragosa TaxID=2714763 RepID=A0A179I3Z5_CORDF|nr:hypothetical protein LLEC1_04349 [Akanthomyces lecanii]
MPPSRQVVVSSLSGLDDVSTLKIVHGDVADPIKDQVQVSVIYAGFSGSDINMRLGQYPLQRAAPLTLGYCCLGRVSAPGPNASSFQVGDLVTAVTVYDSQADLINIREKHLVPVPDGLDLQKAAALPLDWNTAYGMVMRAAKVSQGQRVFVHGLSGAVGYAVLSLCKLQGATIYGTASLRNHSALRDLGATPFVYSDKQWIAQIKAVGGAHAVFDPLGFGSWDESYSILSDSDPSVLVGYGGNLASLNGDKEMRSPFPSIAKLLARNLRLFSNKSTTFFDIDRDQSTFKPELLALLDMLKNGRIDVSIKHVWDLEEIQNAHESWGKAPGIGSILVRVGKE